MYMMSKQLLKNKCKVPNCGYEIPKADREPEEHRVMVLFAHILSHNPPKEEMVMLERMFKQFGITTEDVKALYGNDVSEKAEVNA